MNTQEEILEPQIIVNVRDEDGNLMEGIEVAIYKTDRTVLLTETTGQDGKVSLPLKRRMKRPMEIEVRCRRKIENGVRYNPFSEMHTVFPGGFELNVKMKRDPFFSPAE